MLLGNTLSRVGHVPTFSPPPLRWFNLFVFLCMVSYILIGDILLSPKIKLKFSNLKVFTLSPPKVTAPDYILPNAHPTALVVPSNHDVSSPKH